MDLFIHRFNFIAILIALGFILNTPITWASENPDIEERSSIKRSTSMISICESIICCDLCDNGNVINKQNKEIEDLKKLLEELKKKIENLEEERDGYIYVEYFTSEEDVKLSMGQITRPLFNEVTSPTASCQVRDWFHTKLSELYRRALMRKYTEQENQTIKDLAHKLFSKIYRNY